MKENRDIEEKMRKKRKKKSRKLVKKTTEKRKPIQEPWSRFPQT